MGNSIESRKLRVEKATEALRLAKNPGQAYALRQTLAAIEQGLANAIAKSEARVSLLDRVQA